jgi:uncharacterized repeat protein (TIGR03803 family)
MKKITLFRWGETMSFATDLLIENPLRGNGWKKFFALTLVLMATAFVASAQTITTLHSFTFDDGANPNLVTPTQGDDGNIYATTSIGGSKTTDCFCGTAFKITPQGALTSVSLDGTDGAIPDAGFLLGRNGLLYGTTSTGGASGNGEVFSLNPKTMAITVLHSFTGSDGASPEAPLTLGPGGKYYGTTTAGGSTNNGTVFSITPSGIFKSLHSFSGAGVGQNPSAGLTLGSDGALYGVTYGTIFKITASGTFTKLSDVAPSLGSLLLAADGNMYGTTVAGGGVGQGTVFKLTPAGIVTVLHSFDGIDGANPEAGLLQASDGKIYGTTVFGGGQGEGSIFSITTDGTLTTLYSFPSFDHVDGANPFGLMQHTDGKFYGTASEGGTSINCDSFDSIGCGTVFSLDLGLGPFVTFVVPSGKVGSVIQILGTDLTGATAVSFNGVPASSFKVLRGTLIKATLPAGATTGPVTVTTSTGTLTSNVNFTVLP